MVATTQFPSVKHNPIERAFQRSSEVKQRDLKVLRQARELAPHIWQKGMDLLLEIKAECAATIKQIWDAPDAEEFAREKVVPVTKRERKEIEATLLEMEQEMERKTLTKPSDEFFKPEKREQAKKELAMGGEL